MAHTARKNNYHIVLQCYNISRGRRGGGGEGHGEEGRRGRGEEGGRVWGGGHRQGEEE